MTDKIQVIDAITATKDERCMLYIVMPRKFLSVAQKIADKLMSLVDKDISVEVKRWREKRSLDANAYAWKLLHELAKKLGSEKELLYQDIVKKVGVFEILPIRNDAVNEWIRKWKAKGLGWISESMGGSKIKDYTNTINYFGSSVYNSKEMWILIEEIIFHCKQNDIETLPPDELARLEGLKE